MAEGTSESNYDGFIAWLEELRDNAVGPNCVMVRSVEDAEALVARCIENGIEEPEITVRGQ